MSDWWLSYWVSNSNSTTNDSSTILSAMTADSTHLGYHQAVYSGLTTHTNSEDLKFYLGIYGGLAAANSVSCDARHEGSTGRQVDQ